MVFGEVMTNPYLQNKYVQAILIILVFYILSHITTYILKKFVKKITDKTKTKIDDLILEKSYKPFVWSLIIIGFKIGITRLALSEKVQGIFQHLFNSIITILIIYLLYVIVQILLESWGQAFAQKTKSTLDDDLLPLLHKVVKVIFVILGAFFVLGEWKVDITGLLAGVGVAGLAIGFAVKDSLANIFGGISIILDKAFKVGDVIQTSGGDTGTVTDIGLRSTRIRTWDNELLIIPNGELANNKIQNFKQPDESVRAIVQFGVEYGSNVGKVKKVVKACLKTLPEVIKTGDKAPAVQFMEMGDSSLNFRATFWVKSFNERFGTKEKATCLIYETLNKSKVGIPFPTRTIYMKKE
tara:strand:- start:56235 stop:57296 length:1062 start_codon:yes stop_codon:yes gene_type:complete